MRHLICAAAALALCAQAAAAQPFDPYASAGAQSAAMAAGRTRPEALVRGYLDRIQRIDAAGPKLNAILWLDPQALAAAREAGRAPPRSPLHGITVLLKDNIETARSVTTAGSLALIANRTGRDAPIVRRLLDAHAVILGKTNLSEWANFRSTRSISGWSAIGGLTRNPHSLDRTACGSSSGSAAAIAAGLAAVAIGTETDGSITCPAAMTGVVGLKPTVGLVSRTGIVPISPVQDTAGPITRTVADAAAVLTVIAGSDPADPATAEADARKSDYLAALNPRALSGARIAVWRPNAGRSPQTDQVFEEALGVLKREGAVLVEVKGPAEAQLGRLAALETETLRTEFKAALNAYLATAAPAVRTRSLDELIAFNAREPRETALFGQEIFEASAKAPPITDPKHVAALAEARKIAKNGLDAMLAEARADVIVSPSNGPASIVDPVNGSRFFGSPSSLPAVSGYPHLTVPAGFASGLPVGVSFLGAAWSEARLMAVGHAFEQAARAGRPPQFLPSLGARPEIARAYDPPR